MSPLHIPLPVGKTAAPHEWCLQKLGGSLEQMGGLLKMFKKYVYGIKLKYKIT